MDIFEGNPFKLTAMASLQSSVGGSSPTLLRWNSADKAASVTLSSSDLVATTSGSDGNVRATISKSSGKWYFEATITTLGNRSMLGLATSAFSLTASGTDATAWWYWFANGAAEHGGAVDQTGGGTGANGNVIGVAVDFTGGKIYYAINNTWQFSADPVAGTNGQTFTGGTVFPICGTRPATNPVWTLPDPSGSLTYTPPTGYSRWA